MGRTSGTSLIEGVLLDWVQQAPEPELRGPVRFLDGAQVADQLAVIERNRARDAAREAELILRLAELRPDADDPAPDAPGARGSWRKTAAEFPGVSEFFTAEVAHALNLGRGTAAHRARQAFTWVEKLPATFALLQRGLIDVRRAQVLADALAHTTAELAQAVEARLLGEAGDLSPTRLRARAAELLAALDAESVQQRHAEAKRAADARAYETTDGMGVLAIDLPAEELAACAAVLDALARMAKADGDPRPIGQIRAGIAGMLIMRPAEHGQPGVGVQLTVTATLETLEGTSGRPGEVDGFTITPAQLRALLARVGALGLTRPDGGTLTLALVDEQGRLLAALTPAELARLAKDGCPQHPATGQPGGATATPDQATPDQATPEKATPDQATPEATAEATTEEAEAGEAAPDSAAGGRASTDETPATETPADETAGDEATAPAAAGSSDRGCGCPITGMPPATPDYEPRTAHRRFVTTRDRRCRHPNCGQRAGWADHDHVVPHARGGPTTCTNLCCLCRSHHRLKTFAPGWAFRMDPDGTLHVTSPSGVTRTTRPPGLQKPEPESEPDPPSDDPADDPAPF